MKEKTAGKTLLVGTVPKMLIGARGDALVLVGTKGAAGMAAPKLLVGTVPKMLIGARGVALVLVGTKGAAGMAAPKLLVGTVPKMLIGARGVPLVLVGTTGAGVNPPYPKENDCDAFLAPKLKDSSAAAEVP